MYKCSVHHVSPVCDAQCVPYQQKTCILKRLYLHKYRLEHKAKWDSFPTYVGQIRSNATPRSVRTEISKVCWKIIVNTAVTTIAFSPLKRRIDVDSSVFPKTHNDQMYVRRSAYPIIGKSFECKRSLTYTHQACFHSFSVLSICKTIFKNSMLIGFTSATELFLLHNTFLDQNLMCPTIVVFIV